MKQYLRAARAVSRLAEFVRDPSEFWASRTETAREAIADARRRAYDVLDAVAKALRGCECTGAHREFCKEAGKYVDDRCGCACHGRTLPSCDNRVETRPN